MRRCVATKELSGSRPVRSRRTPTTTRGFRGQGLLGGCTWGTVPAIETGSPCPRSAGRNVDARSNILLRPETVPTLVAGLMRATMRG